MADIGPARGKVPDVRPAQEGGGGLAEFADEGFAARVIGPDLLAFVGGGGTGAAEDLASGLGLPVKDEDGKPVPRGLQRRAHARGPGPDNDDIPLRTHHLFSSVLEGRRSGLPFHRHAFPHGDEAGLLVWDAVDLHEAFVTDAHVTVRAAPVVFAGRGAGFAARPVEDRRRDGRAFLNLYGLAFKGDGDQCALGGKTDLNMKNLSPALSFPCRNRLRLLVCGTSAACFLGGNP